MEWVSVQNSSVYGLGIVNTFDLNISNSIFANNGCPKNEGGNAYIVYDDWCKGLFRVNIMKSNYILGLVAGIDFGILIIMKLRWSSKIVIFHTILLGMEEDCTLNHVGLVL